MKTLSFLFGFKFLPNAKIIPNIKPTNVPTTANRIVIPRPLKNVL